YHSTQHGYRGAQSHRRFHRIPRAGCARPGGGSVGRGNRVGDRARRRGGDVGRRCRAVRVGSRNRVASPIGDDRARCCRSRVVHSPYYRCRSVDRFGECPMSLNLTDITLTYPDGTSRLTALDTVSLEVPSGHLTAVIGPSGSGKSSLLAVAATLISPDHGDVVVDGTPTGSLGRAERAELRRTRIGMVFQQSNLLPSLTAVEQLQV